MSTRFTPEERQQVREAVRAHTESQLEQAGDATMDVAMKWAPLVSKLEKWAGEEPKSRKRTRRSQEASSS